MAESREKTLNLRWIITILLLLLGINGLLTRLLEGLWDSLQDRNSPAYVPLEWWMSGPFTLFVFVVLSALLTSFSSLKNWFRTFLLLCGFKVIFAAVTTAFLYLRMDISVGGAALEAMFLSLPSVLVHLLLSSLAVMFLKDALAGEVAEEVLTTPYFAGAEPEEPLSRPQSPLAPPVETPTAPAEAQESPVPPVATTPSAWLSLPVSKLLRSFPEDEFAMSPEQIGGLSASVEIPFDVILPQLPEGKVEVEATTIISAMPKEAFKHPPEEVAQHFPDGKIELPLHEVVSRVPPETFKPPSQELEPDVDAEFPDAFREQGATVVEKPVEAPLEEEAPTPEEEVSAAFGIVPEESLALTEEERLLLEGSKDVVRLSAESLFSLFPEGAIGASEESEGLALPQTVFLPLELIVPQLAFGEVKLPAKFILAQLPKATLSILEADIIRSLPNGEVEIPLREIVPELPPEVFAPPEQSQQPPVEEMPDPFRERKRPHAEGVIAKEGTPPVFEDVEPSLKSEKPQQPVTLLERPGEEVSPGASPIAAPKEEPTGLSYAEMLREIRGHNPLALSLDTVIGLLPEGALRLSREELKHHLGGESLNLPRKMVMGQLKEGRVLVPVEVLTLQLPPEHLVMSVEQIKARFPEGLVELPLREIVGQILNEITEPPEEQKLQPECEEVSPLFHEFPQQGALPEQEQPAVADVEAEAAEVEQAPAELEPTVEHAPAEGAILPQEEAPIAQARTILRILLQKCRSLGISDHLCFTAAENSVVFLAPSGLNREAVACGAIRIMAQLRTFCEDYGLERPYKLIISCGGGALTCGELVRGESAQLILLASLDRSGAGFMSLLLDTFEAELRSLSSLVENRSEASQETCPEDITKRAEKLSIKPDGIPEGVCRKILAAMAEVGIEKHFSAQMDSGQKLLAVWGAAFPFGEARREAQPPPDEHPFSEGIFDIEALSRYCSDAGLGAFESLLLVTSRAKITLGRSSANESEYLLCVFPGSYAEGIVRAKARTAVRLLEQ